MRPTLDSRAVTTLLRILLPAVLLFAVALPAAAGWVPNGVALTVLPSKPDIPQIVSDGAGGAIVAWREYMGGFANISLQRVTAAGDIAPGWPAIGVSASTDTHDHLNFDLAADGEGGAIVVWQDYRPTATGASSIDIYAQRITASGGVAPGWPAGGALLCGANSGQQS